MRGHEVDVLRRGKLPGADEIRLVLSAGIIGDEDAYVVPVGTDNLFKFVYAPAQDRENVNTSGKELYTWSTVSNRNGIFVAQESNFLPMTINPKLIQHWTSGDA